MPSLPRALRPLVPVAGIALLAGCATPAESAGADRISIVASTSVYGDIAAQIAGDDADVTSIISQGNQDPHGYEATARDQLSLSRADLVIQNGGGYDPFVAELLETTGSEPVLLTAVDAGEAAPSDGSAAEAEHAEHEDEHGEDEHEHEHEHGAHEHGENEHVWYSLHAMENLAGRLGDALAALDPRHAESYAANAEDFRAGLQRLEQRAEELSAGTAGATALASESVPLPLLADLGVEDRTPEQFLAALEDGRDVPPAVLADALHLLAAGEIDMVAFNEQTLDATGSRLVDQAEASGVPIVSFRELPPEGTGYLEWMDDNLTAIEEALG